MSRIVKNSLGQEATSLLRQMLLDGRFDGGERLVEDRIASELGISRTPLREALHRLAQEGLLEKRRAGGYALRKLDPDEVEDAVNIRNLLESYAAKLAAQRATAVQVVMLRRNLELFSLHNQAQDMPRLVELNAEFHAVLREAAHSPLLTRQLMELDGVMERMLRRVVSMQEVEWSDRDHMNIFVQVEKGNPEGAALAMQEHVEHGKQRLLAQLREKQGI